MKKFSVKKLALAGMFCALCVVGSVFSFPMFGSKCAPVQFGSVMVMGLPALIWSINSGMGGRKRQYYSDTD